MLVILSNIIAGFFVFAVLNFHPNKQHWNTKSWQNLSFIFKKIISNEGVIWLQNHAFMAERKSFKWRKYTVYFNFSGKEIDSSTIQKPSKNKQKWTQFSHVDKAVEKLWKTCGWSCGKLPSFTALWIAVEKSPSYPQQKPIYPQFYPHGLFRPGQENHHISTVSTGPTIYRESFLNFVRFASLVK